MDKLKRAWKKLRRKLARKIYIVNTFEGFEIDQHRLLDNVYRCKMVRSPGYYRRRRDARECVEENWGDIWETVYDYACIEEVEEGLYPMFIRKWWYKWDEVEGRYVEFDIEELDIKVGNDRDNSFTIG